MFDKIKELTNNPLKKKFRRTFQGFNENGEIIFPETFVKLVESISFPYTAIADENGGITVPLPGTLRFIQCFTFYENDGEARKDFEKFNNQKEEVTSACLILYDGCGNMLEKRTFEAVKMFITPESEFLATDDNHIIVEWRVDYEKSTLEL